MNSTTLVALFEDSRQQVLDNKVFRLLVILTGLPILATFLIGFYPDRMQVLWGFDPIYWKDFVSNFGGVVEEGSDFGSQFIQGFQAIIVNFFGGSLGVMFCIAATAFFMPRVLEKGAADTLFSKPVSRLAILLSRYFAGLLFIACIAFVLVFGMFFGLGLRSGYWDAGFLWGAVTLVYVFGMMHAFSIAIAAMTRSSTAAILMTIVLFFISGGVHGGWITIEYIRSTEASQLLRAERQGEADPEEARQGSEEEEGIVEVLVDVLYGLHYALPKTTDADIITNKLRRALTEPAPDFESEDGELIVKDAPRDFTWVPESASELDGTGLRWEAEDAAITIRRFPRPLVERGKDERRREVAQSGSQRARELRKELNEREDLVTQATTSPESIGGVRMASVSWAEPGPAGTRLRERLHFHFGEWMYEIDFDLPQDFDEVPHRTERRRERFLDPSNMVLGNELTLSREEWYSRALGWTSPWRYNIFFSLFSSLAFIGAMLGLAWLRLRRIDF